MIRWASGASRPRAHSPFARGDGHGFWRRIAERPQDVFRPVRFALREMSEGILNRRQTEISRALRPIDPIQKRRELNELAPGIHEIEIQHLLPFHTCSIRRNPPDPT